MNKIIFNNINYKAGDIEFRDFSFEINTNQVTMLTGRSNSGINELLDILGGIIILDKEPVIYFSDNSKRVIRRSFVFRNGGLISNLNIEENFMLKLMHHFPDKNKEQLLDLIYNKLSEFNLGEIGKKRPSDLSLDEIKTAGFLRAVIDEPDLICMNEPLAECEMHTREKIINYVDDNKSKMTFIVINKTSKEFIEHSDWFVHIQKSKIINESNSIANLDLERYFADTKI